MFRIFRVFPDSLVPSINNLRSPTDSSPTSPPDIQNQGLYELSYGKGPGLSLMSDGGILAPGAGRQKQGKPAFSLWCRRTEV